MRSYNLHLYKKSSEIADVDLNSHLTAEQKAIGRAFQTLVEDNLYWLVVKFILSDLILKTCFH